eukprot:4624354-Alexandrium_andersonii.AAC.1
MIDSWDRAPCVTCGRLLALVPGFTGFPDHEARCQLCHALHMLTLEVQSSAATLTDDSVQIVSAHLAAINETVRRLPREE